MEEGTFEIRLDFKPCTGGADRVFLAMADYVNAFEELVYVVGHSIDPEANFSYQLSSVDKGSLKGVMKCVSSIKSFSQTLSKIPQFVASSMVDLDEIETEEHVNKLAESVQDKVKEETDIHFPNELNINRLNLAKGAKKLVSASERLVDGETIDIKTSDNNVVYLNTSTRFRKDPESLFVELSKEVKTTETLLIKKPVFVGEAMWDFKSIERKKSFSASIQDENWLRRFQNRELPHIDPGDAIIALVSYEAIKEKGSKTFYFTNHQILSVDRPIKSDELQNILDLEKESENE